MSEFKSPHYDGPVSKHQELAQTGSIKAYEKAAAKASNSTRGTSDETRARSPQRPRNSRA